MKKITSIFLVCTLILAALPTKEIYAKATRQDVYVLEKSTVYVPSGNSNSPYHSYVTDYVYNEKGLLIKLTKNYTRYAGETPEIRTKNYTYNDQNHIINITEYFNNNMTNPSTVYEGISNDKGLVTEVKMTNTSSNEIQFHYTYDKKNRIKSSLTRINNAETSRKKYSYNTDEFYIQEKLYTKTPSGGKWSFSRDFQVDKGGHVSYWKSVSAYANYKNTYDKRGNLVSFYEGKKQKSMPVNRLTYKKVSVRRNMAERIQEQQWYIVEDAHRAGLASIIPEICY